MPKVNKLERQTLRLIQDHILSLRRHAGATQQHLSTIDLLVHPLSSDPDMNLIVPSPGVAWPRGSDMEEGFSALVDHNRLPRLQYLSGLFPDAFGRRLAMQDFELEDRRTIWLYDPIAGPFPEDERPYGRAPETNYLAPAFRTVEVNTRRELSTWLRIYRSAAFGVDVPMIEDTAIEPLQTDRIRGDSIFVLGYYLQTPIAAVRAIVGLDAAQIVGPELMPAWFDLGYEEILLGFAIQLLQRRHKGTIYTVSDDVRAKLYRRVGFVRISEIITYTKS